MRSTVSRARRWLPCSAALALVAVPVFGVATSASAMPTAKAQPTLTISTSGTVPVQNYISAAATLDSGVNTPDADLTIDVFGPNNATCSGSPLATTLVETSGNGTYQSNYFYADSAGTYYWTASFEGDASNLPATSGCGAAGSTMVVAKASPIISATASESVPLGGSITDTASLTQTSLAGGTIAFTLYGPGDSTCSNTPVTTLISDVGSSHSAYQSTPFTPTTPGVYHWIAAYSGDDNNAAATTACSDDGAAVIVQGAASTASITLSSDQLQYGDEQVETVTATVATSPTGPIPTGSVTIQQGSLTVCTIPLTSTTAGSSTGTCTFTQTQLHPNSYLLAASYPGDTYVASTLSPGTSLKVTKEAAAVTLHLAHSSAKVGKEGKEHFSVVARSHPGGLPAAGKVAIKIGHRTVCTAKVRGNGKGSCSLSSKQLNRGTYTLKAHYLGTVDFTTATSAPKKLHITG